MKSIFTDPNQEPNQEAVQQELGNLYELWLQLETYTLAKSLKSKGIWVYSKSFGWSYQIKDPKRVVVYLLPRAGYFKVALVFGPKAYGTIQQSAIHPDILAELAQAKVYAEGRGIRIAVTDREVVQDLIQLVAIKIES